jgi:hypothetical protein
VVAGHRISIEMLEQELDTARALSQGPQPDRGDFTRSVLTFLIQTRIALDHAASRGISVSADEVDRELARVITSLGGQEAFDDFLSQRGLAVETVRRVIERSLLRSKVQQDVLRDAGSPGGDQGQAFSRWLRDRLEGAEVQVNPRFGRFDRSTATVVPLESTADLGSSIGR